MNPFDTNGFPPRWQCGDAWSVQPWIGWLHIFSDLLIFLAYFAVPIVVMYFVRQRDDLKFPPVFYLFLGIIFFSCGTVHLIEASIFWWPVYKLSGLAKFVTAIASAMGVVMLVRVLPKALELKSGRDYAKVVEERRKTQERLENEQFLLRTLMIHTPDFIYFKDRESRFTLVNNAIATFFGQNSPKDLMGKTDFDFFPAEFAEEARADELKIMESGTPLIGKEEAEHSAEGKQIWLSSTKMPLCTDSGKVVGLFGLSRDITPQKRAAEVMEEAKQAAEDANRSKSEFLANMSHEIRTPMNGILGVTELLQATELEPRQLEYVDLISCSTDSLLTIITDILDFSKIEAGKLNLDPHDFELRDSIGDILHTFSFQADKKGLELAYDVTPDVPDCLVGDLGRLRQILVNLVGNAIKFTEIGEVVIEIQLKSKINDRVSLHFQVKDTGVGIGLEQQKEIFESFSQAESSTTRTHGGTGLGLAISRKLAELMEGEIWVESELGAGSTFHFTAEFGFGSETSEPLPISLKDLPVLIIDDNKTNRTILQHMMQNWEMKPQTAASGAEGLERLTAAAQSGKPFELVLLDMMMPKMDGEEVARRITEEFGADAPGIFILSSAGQILSTQVANEIGVLKTLVKPLKQSDLFDAINLLDRKSKPKKKVVRPKPVATRPQKILLAEDGQVNQVVATAMLEESGHSVVVAENGQVALDHHEKDQFDVILMDINMPVMDGISATKIIRKREVKSGKHIPIIAMTANAMTGDREKCLEAGMDDYLSKPVRSADLISVLEKFV